MKNINKSLLLAILLLMSHWALYGQSNTIMYLDIPGLDGEYTVPTDRPNVTTPGPKPKNILIQKYALIKKNSFNVNSSNSGLGGGRAEGNEMDLTFRIEQPVIELSKRLFNHTVTPAMNLYIDLPGTTQKELMRIKLTEVSILSIDHFMDGEGILTYLMKVKFKSNLTAVTTYTLANPPTDTQRFCWDYVTNTSCTSTNF
ncbi:type VI secretion system tube protein Hcp [Emticicia sp. C21]|uniref:type VI secretion system tube protein Hcp n=1 Tax=Emticicia sp. C21 TaxID=2302915 RepID=UPI0013143A01|nr:type VI secretion system tube protein Hcp [Emticicia sp. C21]